MSLLNAWITPTEAIVAVDTDGVRVDGSRYASSKLIVIPHINAVVAIRGQAAVLGMLFLQCMGAGLEEFDDLGDALVPMLEESEVSVPESLISNAAHVAPGNEVLAVGWSKRAGRMLGLQAVKRGGDAQYATRLVDMNLSPWHESMADLPRARQALKVISRTQVRWMRESFAGAACGGKLLVAQLSRDGVQLEHQLEFEPMEAAA